MDSPFPTLGVDCPACGASAESGLAFANLGEDGTDFSCAVCAFTIWQSGVLDRGAEISSEEVIARVGRLVPELPSDRAYREPWDRRSGVATWSVAPSENREAVR